MAAAVGTTAAGQLSRQPDAVVGSCPDVNDYVVVGSYGYYDSFNTSQGWSAPPSSGTWSVEEVPLQSNANNDPQVAGLQVLDTVDCVDAADCVAGGASSDTTPV